MVFDFMHGGGGNAGKFYNRSYALNDILDHAIENGEIDPLIVVTPTFYLPRDTDTGVSNAGQRVSVFHQEFIQDLMPAVESRYRTCAQFTDEAGLEASRNHRAFGGFSMGAVITWYQLVNSLDYVAWFMPLSGDCWECRIGGSTINGAFARAGVIDELSLVQTSVMADKDDEIIFHDANGGEYQLIRR